VCVCAYPCAGLLFRFCRCLHFFCWLVVIAAHSSFDGRDFVRSAGRSLPSWQSSITCPVMPLPLPSWSPPPPSPPRSPAVFAVPAAPLSDVPGGGASCWSPAGSTAAVSVAPSAVARALGRLLRLHFRCSSLRRVGRGARRRRTFGAARAAATATAIATVPRCCHPCRRLSRRPPRRDGAGGPVPWSPPSSVSLPSARRLLPPVLVLVSSPLAPLFLSQGGRWLLVVRGHRAGPGRDG